MVLLSQAGEALSQSLVVPRHLLGLGQSLVKLSTGRLKVGPATQGHVCVCVCGGGQRN